jgi:hypothetical protein
MSLFLLFCYAWLELVPTPMRTYDCFMANVSAALCGDDNTFTVSDMAVKYFNVTNVTEIWKIYGIIAKLEAMSSGPLLERKFLSMGFKMWRGVVYPIPDQEKVLSSMIWHTQAHHSIKWSYLKACALLLLSYHHIVLRDIFQGYLLYLEKNYGDSLRSPPTLKGKDILTWADLQSVRRTDNQIVALYSHLEAGGRNNCTALKKFIRIEANLCDWSILHYAQNF